MKPESNDVNRLIGLTFTRVERSPRPNCDDWVGFWQGDKLVAKLYHDQDCCEQVSIRDICGDLSDLEGVPIVVADESFNDPKDPRPNVDILWTFYTFRTMKGTVTLDWEGESNGYYSVGVDFDFDLNGLKED